MDKKLGASLKRIEKKIDKIDAEGYSVGNMQFAFAAIGFSAFIVGVIGIANYLNSGILASVIVTIIGSGVALNALRIALYIEKRANQK